MGNQVEGTACFITMSDFIHDLAGEIGDHSVEMRQDDENLERHQAEVQGSFEQFREMTERHTVVARQAEQAMEQIGVAETRIGKRSPETGYVHVRASNMLLLGSLKDNREDGHTHGYAQIRFMRQADEIDRSQPGAILKKKNLEFYPSERILRWGVRLLRGGKYAQHLQEVNSVFIEGLSDHEQAIERNYLSLLEAYSGSNEARALKIDQLEVFVAAITESLQDPSWVAYPPVSTMGSRTLPPVIH